MPDPDPTPPAVDTDASKLAELARAEEEQGIVDQQAAAAAYEETHPD